jgi:iron uptake system component EfeO
MEVKYRCASDSSGDLITVAHQLNSARAFFGGAMAALCLGVLAPGAPAHAGDELPLEAAAAAFKPYFLERISHCIAIVKLMRERVAARDLPGAQQSWLAARGSWEESEVITNEFFPDLDRRIDAWPDAEQGFHAIEAKLFGAHDVQVLQATEELIDNLTEFERRLRATTLTAQGLLNGSAKLIYEIGENKAQGGESPFSGNSLAEMRVNVASVAATYERTFAPLMKKRNVSLAKAFSREMAVMQALVGARTLQELDQERLRDASESLANDLAMVGKEAGLERPNLGN